MSARRLLTLLLLLAAAPAVAQSAYRWVDEHGHVQFSDQPPPQEVQKFKEERLPSSRSDQGQPSYTLQKAAANFPVTLYSGRECTKPCDDARALLTRRGVPFTEKALQSLDDVEAFKARFGTEPFVPTLTVGHEKQIGFAPGAWDALLDMAGYPAAKR